MLDSSFCFDLDIPFGEPKPSVRLCRIAERVQSEVGAEVAVALDLSSPSAELAVVGAMLECTPDKEALIMAWLQEVETPALRPTPPKLLSVFGCFEVLVVPIQTPARMLGALAVSLPAESKRTFSKVYALAAELALELERDVRRAEQSAFRARLYASETPTDPAPPRDELDEVA